MASVSVVRNCLDQFRVPSCLSPNPDKSIMFLCCVAPDTKMQLLGVLGYREGKLLVRYLGVPLITSKLSYADRLQLLNSILFAIQVYLSCLFIPPKVVMEKITSLLRSFLWKGIDLSYGNGKVAWDTIYWPKKEGVWVSKILKYETGQ